MWRLGQQAIVVGGSIAGLVTARVLSEFFDQVLVVERDDIEDRPVVRRSVPQGHHLHALLHGGLQVVSSLYPSFADDLTRLGAIEITLGRDVVWYLPDGKAYSPTGSVRTPFDCCLEACCASRGLLEFAIRRRTRQIANVRFEHGAAVAGLIHLNGRVTGVRCVDGRSFAAELVVDATGRGHKARAWFAAMDVSAPEETAIGLDTAYSTALFRRPDSFPGEPIIFITGPAPRFTRRGYVITIENGTLLISLIGRFGDYPPTDRDGFLAFAKQLHHDLAYWLIREAEQLSPIAHHRFASSVRRHYERMERPLEGFLAIGDALCTFNPIYAQGMSAAAKQAEILQQVLTERAAQARPASDIAACFFAKAAEFNSTPWNLAANFDFAFPQTRGIRPPGTEERARYLAALDRLQTEDSEVRLLMTQVFHLTQPLSILSQEPVRSRVLRRMAV